MEERRKIGGSDFLKNLEKQYKNASNLNARIRMHHLYSTNAQDWHEWLFQQYDIPERSSILELGCGNGVFWSKNQQGVSSDWDITLTDLSVGMLDDASQQLGKHYQYKQADIHQIPFEADTFDIVIANHMLYHVENLDQALSEVKRVLKPGGMFYCSTVGSTHLKGFEDLVKGFDERLEYPSPEKFAEVFGLENGEEKLSHYFQEVRLKKFEDALDITERQAIIDYLCSTNTELSSYLKEGKVEDFFNYLEAIRNKNDGVIRVEKSTGFFEAKLLERI